MLMSRTATKNFVIKTHNSIINNFLARHALPALQKKTPAKHPWKGEVSLNWAQ